MPDATTLASAVRPTEHAEKFANTGIFQCLSASEIPGFELKLPLGPKNFSRFPMKFPFLRSREVENGSILHYAGG